MVDYNELKKSVIVSRNITFCNGYYHYVDHARKLATTGFSTTEMLIKYSSSIRFDWLTVDIMAKKYKERFENGQAND